MNYCDMGIKTKHVIMRMVLNCCACRMDVLYLGVFVSLGHEIKLSKA